MRVVGLRRNRIGDKQLSRSRGKSDGLASGNLFTQRFGL